MAYTKEQLKKSIHRYAEEVGEPLTPEETQALETLSYADLMKKFRRLRGRSARLFGFGLKTP